MERFDTSKERRKEELANLQTRMDVLDNRDQQLTEEVLHLTRSSVSREEYTHLQRKVEDLANKNQELEGMYTRLTNKVGCGTRIFLTNSNPSTSTTY